MKLNKQYQHNMVRYSIDDIIIQKRNLIDMMDSVNAFKNVILVEIIQNNREAFEQDARRYIREQHISYSAQDLIDDTIYYLSTRGEILIFETEKEVDVDGGVRRFLSETKSGIKIRPGHIRMIRKNIKNMSRCIKNKNEDPHIEQTLLYTDGTESKDQDAFFGDLIEEGYDKVDRELELKEYAQDLQRISNIYGIDLLNLFYLITDKQLMLQDAILKMGISQSLYRVKINQIREDLLAKQIITRFLLSKSGISLPENCKPLITGLFLVEG